MKKLLTLVVLLMTTISFSQVLYEKFDYIIPGYIGGNLTTTTDAVGSNNWTTHSNTATTGAGTIDVISGNLSYTGLVSSVGNKILLPGNNTTTPRDINRAITITGTTVYYSVLINVIDNTQLSTTPSYFIGLGTTAGTSVTGLGARLGIVSSNSGYKLSIQNTSGGTPTFTENAVDLTFGTTYLVVVKYNTATSPTTATLWVNPSNLGGTEPTSTITNNSGTTAFSTIASVFLRNTTTTPKVELDEIRVGATWSEVTPVSTMGTNQNNKMGLIVYPNPVNNGLLNIQTADNSVKNVVVYDLLGKQVLNTSTSNTVNVSSLESGIYTMRVTEDNNTDIMKIVIN
jgi:Secretion system C-terminal sorting domain